MMNILRIAIIPSDARSAPNRSESASSGSSNAVFWRVRDAPRSGAYLPNSPGLFHCTLRLFFLSSSNFWERSLQMPCKPFSITLAVLAPDNKRQVSFAVSKGCITDDQPFYVLNFVLRDRVDGDFQDRVRLHVTVGEEDNPKAQALIDAGLTKTQLGFLQGPMTNKTKTLPKGTTSDSPCEKSLASIVNK